MLQMARFRGLDKLAPFEDNRRYWGNAFGLLRRAERFLLDHTPIASRVLARREREDTPAYLPSVTREGLANALCHRDYSQAGGLLSVAMFDDRLVIANPGELHFGLTPKALETSHTSMPWNPLIAGVFYRAGIIESWGSGTTRMVEACRAGDRPIPWWESDPQGVRLVLPRPRMSPEDTPEDTPEVTPEVHALLLQCRASRSRKDLQAALGLRDPDHFRVAYLQPALEAGLIEMTRPDKPKSPLQRYRSTTLAQVLLERVKPQGHSEATPEATPEATTTPEVRALLLQCTEPRSRKELQSLLLLKDPDHLRLNYLLPALEAGVIKMTLPGKPTSGRQRYRATPLGLACLANTKGGR